GKCVHESNRVVIVAEHVAALERAFAVAPAGEFGELDLEFAVVVCAVVVHRPRFARDELLAGEGRFHQAANVESRPVRCTAAGCESWNAECTGSGVSVESLSWYCLTIPLTRWRGSVCCSANAAAWNSWLREASANIGCSGKVN